MYEKKIYKCEAEGDVVYILAVCEDDAEGILFSKMGDIPTQLLKWSVVDELPEGEEFL